MGRCTDQPSLAILIMIGLVDCDCFYVSCERLFDPKLRGRPVICLSNNVI
ncbi:hypothetical protein [Thalassospira lucentensis]